METKERSNALFCMNDCKFFVKSIIYNDKLTVFNLMFMKAGSMIYKLLKWM